MPDIEQEVRALLERRANDVPPRVEVPPTLVRRARTRFAAYAVGVAAAVVVVAGIGAAALQSAPGGPVTAPGNTSPSVGSPAACTAGQLFASSEMGGAMGSREGTIVVRATDGTSCVLHGAPGVALTGADGASLPVDVIAGQPGWKVDGEQEPSGWPDVQVDPGHAASLRVRWSNWCQVAQPAWTLQLDDGTSLVVGGIGADVPPCNGPGQPSTIEIGPFEPASG